MMNSPDKKKGNLKKKYSMEWSHITKRFPGENGALT